MLRKVWLWLFLVIALIGVAVAMVAVFAVSDTAIPENAASLLSTTLEVSAPLNPGNELLLLPDDKPITLKLIISDQLKAQGQTYLYTETEWESTAGSIEPISMRSARWIPPETSETVKITARTTFFFPQNTIEILFRRNRTIVKECSVLLLSPISNRFLHKGVIDGFTIGEYLDPQDKRTLQNYADIPCWVRIYPQRYKPPDFFYKVSEENRHLHISPHYTLGHYAMDYPWYSLGFPQYIALDYGLFQKLEELQVALNEAGYEFDKFKFVYGFRSPDFNLGTIEEDPEGTLKVPFSMHQYGRAADIIIDTDGDDVLDDLNGDGRITIDDARVILKFIDTLDQKYRSEGSELVGGAGIYSHNDFQGRPQSPYVHIDIRGFTHSDGRLVRWTIP